MLTGASARPPKLLRTLSGCTWALIASHLDEFKANERKVRRIKTWSSWMVGLFIASVIFLGASMLSYAPDMRSPEDTDDDAAASELFDYDDVPFEPTFVEKGDNPYYETRSD